MGKGYGRGGFYNYFCLSNELWGCGRRICGCICFLFLIGPALVIAGISLLVVAGVDPRDAEINSYNVAIDSWTGSGYAHWQSQGPYGVTAYGDSTYTLMDNITVPDTLADNDLSKVHPYSQYLVHESRGQYTPLTVNYNGYSVKSNIMITNIASGVQYNAPVVSVLPSYITPSGLGCSSSSSSSSSSSNTNTNTYSSSSSSNNNNAQCSADCTGRGGYWSSSQRNCYLVQTISSVCIKVGPNGDVDIKDPLCFGAGTEQYGPESPDSVQANGGVSSKSLDVITVTLRSSADPYIQAYILTDGTLSFGLTSAQFAGIGIALLVIGGAIIAAICGFIIFLCRAGHFLNFGGSTRSYGSSRSVPMQTMQVPVQSVYVAQQPVYAPQPQPVYTPQPQPQYMPPPQPQYDPQPQYTPPQQPQYNPQATPQYNAPQPDLYVSSSQPAYNNNTTPQGQYSSAPPPQYSSPQDLYAQQQQQQQQQPQPYHISTAKEFQPYQPNNNNN